MRLTSTAPVGRPASAELVDGVQRLLHGQVLELGDEVDRGAASECSSSTTPSLCVWIGPVRASEPIALVTSRNFTMRPVGGASSTTAS